MPIEIINPAKSRVTIHEQDLGVGPRRIAFCTKEIHEVGTELHVHHRSKKLLVEYVPDDSQNLIAMEVM